MGLREVREWLSEDHRGATGARKALYFGMFGALGATCGWFIWVAVAILVADFRDVWISALVGGLLGILFEGAKRYRQATRARPADAPNRFPVAVPLLGVAGTFLAVAGENSLAELVKEVRIPVLTSVLTFFVGGVAVLAAAQVAGWFDDDRDPSEVASRYFGIGLCLIFLGALIAAPLSLLHTLAGLDASYRPLAAWWAVISVVAGIAVLQARKSALRAASAGLAALGFMTFVVVCFGFGPSEVTDRYTPPSTPRLGQALTGITQGLLAGPDVPARTWTAAQDQLRVGDSTRLVEPRLPEAVSGTLGALTDCDDIPAGPDELNPASYLERKREMCRQLAATTPSEWTRSVIVLGSFCGGLIVAARLERRWRPEDYGSHPLRRYDSIGLVTALVLLVLGVVTLRLAG